MVLLVGGVDLTNYIREDESALGYQDSLGVRNRLHVTLIDPTNALVVAVGAEVTFTDDASAVPFGGTVEAADREILTAQDDVLDILTIELDCVSYDQLLDRRLLAAEYVDALAGDIMRDVADLLADEGVDDLYVEDGPTLAGRIVFDYETLADVADQVGKLTGMASWIDADKHLHFQVRTSTAAAFPLDDDTAVEVLKVSRTREGYRNVQYIRGGQGLTDPRPESFVGDGERRSFTLAFPAGTEPTVTVNAVAKTVGINGVETGFDWYWNKESDVISQDDADTPLADTDTLEVTYQGLFPVLVQARDDTAIAERMGVEGGSGVYEAKEDRPNIQDQDVALGAAVARLQQEGYIKEQVEFRLRTTGLKAGMLLPVSVTREGLSGEYLITEVQGACFFQSQFRYTVTAVNGDGVGSWADYFRNQASDAQSNVPRDNEALLLLRAFSEPLICDDALTVTPASGGPAKIDEAIVGFSEIG